MEIKFSRRVERKNGDQTRSGNRQQVHVELRATKLKTGSLSFIRNVTRQAIYVQRATVVAVGKQYVLHNLSVYL